MMRLLRRLPLPVLLIAPSLAIILFVVLLPLIFSLYTASPTTG